MNKIYCLLLVAPVMILISCNNNNPKTNESQTNYTSSKTKSKETKPEINISGCYMQVLSRDTFAASLQQQGNFISGKLSFDNYEKDGSTGTVNGRVENGIVKLLYSFASEGTNSVMEVYFKHDNGKLLSGTGDMDTKKDTAYFKDPSYLKYDGGKLQKLPCPDLPGKYK